MAHAPRDLARHFRLLFSHTVAQHPRGRNLGCSAFLETPSASSIDGLRPRHLLSLSQEAIRALALLFRRMGLCGWVHAEEPLLVTKKIRGVASNCAVPRYLSHIREGSREALRSHDFHATP
jgi:hypothetical protein